MASAFFDLVLQLRAAGLRLDIDAVKAVIQAISSGRGLEGDGAFRALCAALWVRSPQEKLVFDAIFDQCQLRQNSPSVPPQDLQISRDKTLASTTTSEKTGLGEPQSIATPGFELRQSTLSLALSNKELEAWQIVGLPSRDYLPITRNQTKQSWRYLRLMQRYGPKTEVDLFRTLRNMADHGDLTEPIMTPRRLNRARLTLLIDTSASMVAFHELGRRLLDTAKSGQFRSVQALYFSNVIGDHLFYDFGLSEGLSFAEFCGQPDAFTSYIMVLSDFGAARGGFDPQRVEHTLSVARAFAHQRLRIAWINPVPMARWRGTSAEKISRYTHMFELSRRGLDLAIGYLRGVRTSERFALRVSQSVA